MHFFDRYNFKQQIEYAHSSEGNNVRITYRGDESDKYIFYKRKRRRERRRRRIERTWREDEWVWRKGRTQRKQNRGNTHNTEPSPSSSIQPWEDQTTISSTRDRRSLRRELRGRGAATTTIQPPLLPLPFLYSLVFLSCFLTNTPRYTYTHINDGYSSQLDPVTLSEDGLLTVLFVTW